MKMDNNLPSRRTLLRAIGATSLGSVVAGCANLFGTSIDAEATVGEQDGQRLIQLKLSVTPANDVERVFVKLNGTDTATFEEIDNPMQFDIPVSGGRAYEITIIPDIGEGGTSTNRKHIDIGFVPKAEVPLHGDRTLCAHYYSWYDAPDSDDWGELAPHEPVLGEYSSRSEEVIKRHLDWCDQAGINWLSTAWWGPDSFTDESMQEYVLEIDETREFTWSIIYESAGRFDGLPVDIDTPDARERLASDLAYLDEYYFNEPWYHTIEGRPVVFVFSAFELNGDAASVWNEATEPLETDPYLIADIDNNTVPDVVPIVEAADAVTTYNPYQAREDIEEVFREETESMYRKWFLGREFADVDVMPTAIPGYNDSLLRDNPVLEPSRDLYDWCARTARKYATNHDVVFITSFNEWYEGTQIEPYREMEEHLIDLTNDVFTDDEYTYPQFDGTTLTLEFETILRESEVTDDEDADRELTFRCDELAIESPDGEVIESYNIGSPEEILIVSGTYRPSTDSESGSRWFGGSTTTGIYLDDFSPENTVVLIGSAITEMDAVARVNGEQIGSATLSESSDAYRFT